jgi:hypothetical protein
MDASKEDAQRFLDACQYTASVMNVEFWIDAGASLSTVQVAMLIRGAIMERINKINEVHVLALSRGYLLPDSPFPKIEAVNAGRRLFQDLPWDFNTQVILQNAAKELSEVAQAFVDGKVTFDRKPAAQLSSYEVSVDGISPQSGDALADILGYQPDGDFVKRKRAIDALAKLDFSKRKPYLLFTLESDDGITVCWSKMRDAAGYIISRRDVFAGVDLPPITLSNEGLEESTNDLLQDEKFWQALSFYDWAGPHDVYAYTDDGVIENTLYSYRISGLQRKVPATPFIFDVPMNALLFSPTMAQAATKALQDEATRFGRDTSTISPYPALSEALYGDPGFGWVIAGCNVLASIRRGDAVDDVRANSYIGSRADRIFAEARAGRLFVPTDVGTVQKNVEAAISSYGVSQTILSILDGTGATNFISGKDDPNGIQATQASIEGSTAGLARILSVIDPETATLDPTLISVASRAQIKSSKSFAVDFLDARSGPTPPSFAEIAGSDVIDLTTYSGINRFMQILRAIYDFYPGAFS